jgi:hypothetical protein
MSANVTTRPADRFSFGLSRLLHRILEVPERRYRRYAQARAEWIAEARYAPTVQELLEMSGR